MRWLAEVCDGLVGLLWPRPEPEIDPRTIMVARWVWRHRRKLQAEELQERMRAWERRWAVEQERGQLVRFSREFRP